MDSERFARRLERGQSWGAHLDGGYRSCASAPIARLVLEVSSGRRFTAHTMVFQSVSGSRITVTKSFTPNTDATPSASAARTNGVSSPWPRIVSIRAGRVTSSVNFIAFGFGVVEGRTRATRRAYAGPNRTAAS